MYQEILRDLKNKIYKPIYFLMGEEPYFIDNITDYIADNVLTDAEKTFNQMVLYGKDTDIATVINTAKRFPMMANYQVVIVKEAQNLKNIDDLIYYAEKPLKSTVLVINYKYKKLDKRKKLFNALSEHAVLFDSARLYDAKIPGWVTGYLKERSRSIEPSAVMMLVEFLGNDLGKIVNELDKLLLMVPENVNLITPDHIEKNIGISKEYNNFELHKALAQKNVLKANRIIHYFAKNSGSNPIVLTITSLYYFFSKVLIFHFLKDKSRKNAAAALRVSPFFMADYELAAKKYTPRKVVDIISFLREYDLKSKGMGNVSASQGDLLKEMVFKILH